MSPRLAAAVTGAVAAAAAGRLLARVVPGGSARWERSNAAGAPVTLLEGPAYALGALAAVATAPRLPPRLRAAGLLATGTAGALGAYDDLAGSGADRGVRGHLAALRRGHVTTGAVKVVGIGAAGLVAGALLHRDPVDALLAGAVVAGSANLANLLDLRPGRALKGSGLVALPLAVARPDGSAALAAAALGAGVAVLPDDLAARSMLGDAGANALGALVGVALAERSGRAGLVLATAVLVTLTAASERVSFTAVIEGNRVLRSVDRLGRRAA